MLGLLQLTFSNFSGDRLNEKQRHRAAKADWKKIPTRRKTLTEQDKLAVAEIYERRLEQGEPRESILADFSNQWAVSVRQVERYVSQGRALKAKKLKNRLDLPWFADRLLKSVKVPEPLQVYELRYLETGELWLEKQSGFHTFKKHFSHKIFWNTFKSWKSERASYCQKCFDLLDTISCEAERESQMKITEEYDEEGIYDTFPARVYEHILLKTKPWPDSLSRGYFKNLEEMHFDINGDEIIVREQRIMVAKGKTYQFRRLVEVYQKLTSNPSLLETAKQIWHLYHELRDTTNYLYEELNNFYSSIAPNWVRFSSSLEIF